jgi:hypothetical protein
MLGDHPAVAVAKCNCPIGVLEHQRLKEPAGNVKPLSSPISSEGLRAIHLVVSETAARASIVVAVTAAVAAVTKPKAKA